MFNPYTNGLRLPTFLFTRGERFSSDDARSTANVRLTCSNGVERRFMTHGWRDKPTDESQKSKLIVYPWACHAIRG